MVLSGKNISNRIILFLRKSTSLIDIEIRCIEAI